MATKNNPGAFDCYANADPDEPIFVLKATDPLAPGTVRMWASRYEIHKRRKNKGYLTLRQERKVAEAQKCADDMARWYEANVKPSAPKLSKPSADESPSSKADRQGTQSSR